MPILTKSGFLKGRQCGRRLWLALNRPPEPEIDPEEVWGMREAEGAAVELHAESLFSGLILIEPGSDEDDTRENRPGLSSLIVRTRDAIQRRLPIAQAYLTSGNLLSVTDILEPRGSSWYLWEVKASNSIKPVHDWDLAFQVEVARQAGLSVEGAGVIHLDKTYERGAAIDAAQLLVRADRTPAVNTLAAAVQLEIGRQLGILEQTVPAAQPSAHCKSSRGVEDGNRPSTCGHLGGDGYCGSRLPVHWAGQLPWLSEQKWAEIHAMPNPAIEELDADEKVGKKPKWTPSQQMCIRAVKTGHPSVDAPELRAKLATLGWPIAYVDFEFDPGMAVPRYSGCHPYDRVPFQWSMHIQERSGGGLVERDPFLHLDATDPRTPFAEALLAALPAEGSIVAHHKAAEIGVVNELAYRLGGSVAEQLRALVGRFFDTEVLARSGYCHPDQRGSWSLKQLAPALLGAGYKGLAIQNGMAAVAAWKGACAEADPAERDRARAALLAYCGRDTSLMHEVVERLRELSRPGA